ncbi:MAG TPA: hypothetical protein VLH79_03360 [Chthonomonadales bacterium]|nr:hypothetical protein [Chthonomonadales bacterium]
MRMLDRRRLRMHPLAERRHKLAIEEIAVRPGDPSPEPGPENRERVARAADRIRTARAAGRPVALTYGAHLVKNGLAPVVIDLVERGWLTHLATNGAGSIHDWEFAFLGRSTEDVRENTAAGRFGTWEETGRWLNAAVAVGAADGLGYGASVARLIGEERLDVPDAPALRERAAALLNEPGGAEGAAAVADLLHLVEEFGLPAGRWEAPHPWKRFSIQDAAHRTGTPFTVHPGIGYDIIYTHPLNAGGPIGRGAVRDFLLYAEAISRLEGGVHLAVGSSVMAPMIFEKCLSMANNLALEEGRPVLSRHHMAVVDLQEGGDWDWSRGEPPMDHPAYYLRFCKSFHRMGGTLDYLCMDNRAFLLRLHAALEGGRA